MAMSFLPGLYLMPNQAAARAGAMATNAHAVTSGKVAIGLITGIAWLIDVTERAPNSPCIDDQANLPSHVSRSFSSYGVLLKAFLFCVDMRRLRNACRMAGFVYKGE